MRSRESERCSNSLIITDDDDDNTWSMAGVVDCASSSAVSFALEATESRPKPAELDSIRDLLSQYGDGEVSWAEEVEEIEAVEDEGDLDFHTFDYEKLEETPDCFWGNNKPKTEEEEEGEGEDPLVVVDLDDDGEEEVCKKAEVGCPVSPTLEVGDSSEAAAASAVTVFDVSICGQCSLCGKRFLGGPEDLREHVKISHAREISR